MLRFLLIVALFTSAFAPTFAKPQTHTAYLLSWTTRDRWIEGEWAYRVIELAMGRYFTHVAMMAMPSDWTLEVKDNKIAITDSSARTLDEHHPDIDQFHYETYPFYLPSYWQAWERDLRFYTNLENPRLGKDDLILEAIAIGEIPTSEVEQFYKDPTNLRFTALRLSHETWHKLTVLAGYTPGQINRAGITRGSRQILLESLKNKAIPLSEEEQRLIEDYWDRLKASSLEIKKLDLTSHNCLRKAAEHLRALLGEDRTPKALHQYLSRKFGEPYPLLKQLEKEGYPVTYSVQTDSNRNLWIQKDQPVNPANPFNLYGTLTGKWLDT